MSTPVISRLSALDIAIESSITLARQLVYGSICCHTTFRGVIKIRTVLSLTMNHLNHPAVHDYNAQITIIWHKILDNKICWFFTGVVSVNTARSSSMLCTKWLSLPRLAEIAFVINGKSMGFSCNHPKVLLASMQNTKGVTFTP